MSDLAVITQYNRLRCALDIAQNIDPSRIQQALDYGTTIDEMVKIMQGDDESAIYDV